MIAPDPPLREPLAAMSEALSQRAINTPFQVLFASLIGTTIEFFDFYIYGTAAVLVFPHLFFPEADPSSAALASLATFGAAFVARPIGSLIFGHFGDRLGRKTTLVLALLCMGLSTFIIGVLPGYGSIGLVAPVLLTLCRFGQGIGLGGEWGGAVLLAVENAPPGKRAIYGMFPQFGAPIGFLFSSGSFLLLTEWLTDQQFLSFGWRIPFLASAGLVLIGLYVRLKISETPVFRAAEGQRVNVPVIGVFRHHARAVIAGILICLATFVLFYLMTVFALSWGIKALHYNRTEFLLMQLLGIVFFALGIPVSALLAERGRRPMLAAATILIGLFGFVLAPLFLAGAFGVIVMLCVGLGFMGLTYGPLGTAVAELFPTPLRYTGSSLAFSIAGILGASLTPYAAMWLAQNHGLQWVGYYLTASTVLTGFGLLMIRETQHTDLDDPSPEL
jgi:metabolite-proton symporter